MAAALVRTQSPPPFAYTLLKCCLSCPTVYLCNECEYVERIEGSCDRLNVHACLCVSASKGIMVWLHMPHLTCVCEFLGIDVAISMWVHGLLQDFNSQHPFFLKVWWRKCFSTESLLKKHSSILVLRERKGKRIWAHCAEKMKCLRF